MAQAMILGGGVLIFMMMMASGLNVFIYLGALPFIAGITAFLMFKRVYDIPIYEFGLVYFTYKASPKLLVYRKENLRDEYIEQDVLFLEEG
jgi:hypothetical protein